QQTNRELNDQQHWIELIVAGAKESKDKLPAEDQNGPKGHRIDEVRDGFIRMVQRKGKLEQHFFTVFDKLLKGELQP
ncbi:MAG: hypothetical protein KKG59_07570, partial [Nanoarchaeota archaeon]|nr:hypothetical protein [Nanoarchaeota archaeon]